MFILGPAVPAKQHIKDNANGDGSETDMIMQLLQHNQLIGLLAQGPFDYFAKKKGGRGERNWK